MDLNDLWQGNKKFILGVGAGLVVWLAGLGVVASTWDTKPLADSSRAAAAAIRKMQVPREADLASLRKEGEELTAKLDELYRRMQFKTHEDFVLAKNQTSPDLFYNSVRDKEAEQLLKAARQFNIKLDPTLGLPEFTPPGSEAIQRYLRALNVVHHVVEAALTSQVRAIDKIEVRDTKGASRGKEAGFVDALLVHFEIAGSSAAIADLIDALVRVDEQFLAIDECQLEIDEKRHNWTIAKLTVAALAVNPEAVITAGDKK